MKTKNLTLLSGCLAILLSCNEKGNGPSPELVKSLELKRGDVISCGPGESEFGIVNFMTSCSADSKKDFNMAMAMLHSFEYDESEKLFAKIIDKEPGCAMAYWGVAMSNYHPLWSPPDQKELEKGSKAVEIARSINNKSTRESEYIYAIGQFYKDYKTLDHHTRTLAFEKAMEKIYKDYPDDKEAALLYCLALDAAADPADKSYANQKRSGQILASLYPGQPLHPGLLHYIIHTYDVPELAHLGLDAARKYASIAPSSSHAQHMPSHIFTRLGLWDEDISSNLAAVASAKCYAETQGLKGHWDEELHGLDYLVYAYLQKGDNNNAKAQYDYLNSINEVSPPNFKVFYAFAAIPARYTLENRDWIHASRLAFHPATLSWDKFPWQKAMIYFARLLGSVHQGQLDSAFHELGELQKIRELLLAQKDQYKATHVEIQIRTGQAWIAFKKGNYKEAEDLMNEAASLEDRTEKSPVTPGEVLPAREMLGDLYLEMNQPAKALAAYEADLKTHPNRFNGLYGAAVAAERSNDKTKATTYYGQLLKIAAANSDREEIRAAKAYLKQG